MDFINKIKNIAKCNIKNIVLPESDDIRVLKATKIINNEGFAKITLIGNENQIRNLSNENGINLSDTKVIDPNNFEKTKEYINTLYELRKEKGMTYEQAEDLVKNNSRYFATMMLKFGDCDGFVSGACHPTSDTLRPPLQIIKSANGTKIVSGFFIMDLPDNEFGDNGVLVFADSGLNENPDADKLSEIAISSSKSYYQLVNTNGQARVAMLSYSTKGSAHSELTEKVVNATNLVKEKEPNLIVDGELQLDAAIIQDVQERKAPGSPVGGKANILIFPDLDSGNIGYKLTQRFGNAKAYGPLLQGLAKPVNDLSRGCSAEDITGVVAITCVQAQANQQ